MGFFGNYGNSTYRPASSIEEAGTTIPDYDVSGIAKANKMLDATTYKGATYNPYQFGANKSNMDAFGKMYQNVGPYGASSDKSMNDLFNSTMSASMRPALAQGNERMRQATQGFGGMAGGMGGAAAKELAMKSAMSTGADIASAGADVGKTIAERKMGQEELGREKDYAERQNVRDVTFQAAQTQQLNQATENYKAAGFTDQQAQYLAQLNLNKANTMFQVGFKLPEMQNTLWQTANKQGNALYDQMWGGASYA